MAEELTILKNVGRKEQYESVMPQIEALISYESDLTANLANISAALRQSLGFFWVGFYLNSGKDLVLGPFQGDIACTRIAYDRGVCGASYTQEKILIVADVDAFPEHIACSSASKSEIVVPIIKDGKVQLILDVDSDQLDDFNELDKEYLEKLAVLIAGKL
ncbi:MAG: L-methionine (R)-S-oxide reductase [Bacteroidia bacterium]|jgi:L-methionine (R)-S-oxide reductase